MSKAEIERAIIWVKERVEYISQNCDLKDKDNKRALDNLKVINICLQENINLKMVLDDGLDKNKKYCFYEDGNTGKCLGYSNINDDEPCEYCKSCEALSIKGDD